MDAGKVKVLVFGAVGRYCGLCFDVVSKERHESQNF